MTKIMTKIISILVKWAEIYRMKKLQKKRQKSRDELEKNPTGWYRDNFHGGVWGDKTDKADKADTKADKD